MGRQGQVDFGALPTPADAPKRIVASVERLRRQIGWSPKVALRERLREACDWWQSEAASRYRR
jgi:nucleoside-diphosphate-sugar epimerase